MSKEFIEKLEICMRKFDYLEYCDLLEKPRAYLSEREIKYLDFYERCYNNYHGRRLLADIDTNEIAIKIQINKDKIIYFNEKEYAQYLKEEELSKYGSIFEKIKSRKKLKSMEKPIPLVGYWDESHKKAYFKNIGGDQYQLNEKDLEYLDMKQELSELTKFLEKFGCVLDNSYAEFRSLNKYDEWNPNRSYLDEKTYWLYLYYVNESIPDFDAKKEETLEYLLTREFARNSYLGYPRD